MKKGLLSLSVLLGLGLVGCSGDKSAETQVTNIKPATAPGGVAENPDVPASAKDALGSKGGN
ncbi:hypothetical protein EON79_06905 [bacterium]|nr:MAG: hypothetical protein EON79_06905 [bacterium]